ncbi:WD repeat-containing protein 62 isoform X3 [Agrilus planipennis]|uniref:WD repeat-containing protein 62 isoform X3 n=1 Tax=Agrilus planipennis TaxID=224129 RepID=A0A7F5RG86_AGRPL|nr:WD repeat-containing protein 62 isoform X3 [Agrilus planipennis]
MMAPRNSAPIIEKEIFCTYKVKLERVLGVTVSTNAALDSDSNNETVAYPAGCTVILFNTATGNQSHIINSSRKTITSLSFSSCGRYLVTGECGHQPAVRVWDLQSDPQPGPPGIAPQVQQVAEFIGHKYGINCVAFSPTNKYVVSIGTQHDMIVNVWDWRNNIKVASNKVSTKVKAIAFAENGSYFVTVGNRHVKFWFLEYGNSKYKEAVPLMGRSAILGEQRNNYFCDVACGKAQCGDSTYAITRSGLLCEFNNRRLLDKWVELRTSSANCIAVGENYIFVGCAEGIVRCFDPATLRFITTLPRTHYLGVDVSQGLNISHMSSPPSNAKYPDTIACTFDETSKKLTCIYNDHSIYVWDVHNIKRVGKSFSFLYHSACIWGVEMAPPNSPLPPGSFLTCSSDDTIRVWTLDKLTDKNARGIYQKNIYSNELLKVVYIDRQLNYLKDLDLSFSNPSNEKNETSYDGRNGVRSIRISPDGTHLASGDRTGNIRIHETSEMNTICTIEAHDSEVLCLEYTNVEKEKFLASASRDRLIHVFDVNRNYDLLQTLDDHSSSITAVRFLNSRGNLQMVSCGADKSLIFRSFCESPEGVTHFTRDQNAIGKTTFFDMEVDVNQKHVLTACQDRNVRIYSVSTGKHTRIFKGTTGDDGSLIKVVLDRTGIYLATSSTDKSLSVYDYYTGECMATMCGHSELATGLRFTNDCRRLISAGGDGCIFVWRVPHDMVVSMHARLSQQAMRQGKTLDNEIFTDSSSVDFYDANANMDSDYRFNVGALPLWAKKHMTDDSSPPLSLTKGVAAPKGRWAQRAERNIEMKSFYTDSVISFSSLQERRVDSDEKDSSLDSGTETRHYSELHRERNISKQDEFTATRNSYNEINTQTTRQSISESITIPRNDARRNILTDDSAIGGSVRDTDLESTAHDADIDSDQEYKHQPMYYPSQIDSASGSEFTVTNMDANELRKSQRKAKRANLPSIFIQPTSISGSQDSDEDDDDASTPSGENTDRNPMSMLSVSSESLDQIINREKYLQSTFESLSGGDVDNTPGNKASISSQYLGRGGNSTGMKNMMVINATRKTKNDVEAVKKREELAKRIADTRKKLQSVGFSPLKYSQSTHDLSHIPEKDKWSMSGRKQVLIDDEDSPDNSLRRSCSLSDLSLQAPLTPKPKVERVSGKLTKNQNTTTRSSSSSRYTKSNASMMRSSSTGVLNQSDSETESNFSKVSNRLMRPTISSQNKVSKVKNSSMRKRQSYSVMNLSNIGQDDSSSEENGKPAKPAVPLRSRSFVAEKTHLSAAARRIHNIKEKNKEKKNKNVSNDDTLTAESLDIENLDGSTIQLSAQLCNEVAVELTTAANNAVMLYRRLTDIDSNSSDQISNAQKRDWVKNLELTIVRTQKMFQDLTLEKFRKSNHLDVNQAETVKKLNELVAKVSANDQNTVVTIMQQFSDILLNMLQHKIQNSTT